MSWIRSKSRLNATATGLYGSIVTQARQPAFYLAAGAPDTMEGRFGVIAMHMFLVLERIRLEGDRGDDVARALLETFMTDMDDSMRELGIGDMGVPRRVKKAAAALEEQLAAYRSALASADDAELMAAVQKYVFLEQRSAGHPERIVEYIRRTGPHLANQSSDNIGAGRVTFETFS